jgi:hypothetical protein
VEVLADAGSLVAGSAGCGGLETKESIWELTENLGLEWRAHRLTLGMHHELLNLLSAFRAPDEGAWFFDSLGALEQGRPSRFERNLPGPLAPRGPRADFAVRQVGFLPGAGKASRWGARLPPPQLQVIRTVSRSAVMTPEALMVR